MPSLPKELCSLIQEYINEFNMIMSLPSKKTVTTLIHKSNVDIIKRYLLNPTFMNNQAHFSILTDATIQSLRLYSATGILKWLFLEQDLFLYPEYFELLTTSILFDVITSLRCDQVFN